MANNSATGGYLLPLQASPPLEDAELEAVFQGYIAGVSGLPSNLVRTRWPAAGAEPPRPTRPGASWTSGHRPRTPLLP